MKYKVIAALVFCAVLVGAVVWATSIAVDVFRTASRMHEPMFNQLALVFVVIAFIALTLVIIILAWSFDKIRSKKKRGVRG